MKLFEYTLAQMTTSDITQKSIDKNGTGHVILVSASASDIELTFVFGVESSTNENKHVGPQGQPLPFLTREYAVRFTWTGINKIVPKGWTSQGTESAKQYINQIIKNCDVKVSCDCPAFYWQGMWEDDSEKKTSYFNFAGTKGTGMWSARHQDAGAVKGQQMCKHQWAASVYLTHNNMDELVQKLGITDAAPAPTPSQQVKESVLFEYLLSRASNALY